MTVLFMASTTTVVHWTSHFLQGTRNTRPCITVNLHFLLFTMKKFMMKRRRGVVRLHTSTAVSWCPKTPVPGVTIQLCMVYREINT